MMKGEKEGEDGRREREKWEKKSGKEKEEEKRGEKKRKEWGRFWCWIRWIGKKIIENEKGNIEKIGRKERKEEWRKERKREW